MEDFKYKFIKKDKYILVKTEGTVTTIDQVINYADDIFEKCLKESKNKVLIDDRNTIVYTSLIKNFQIAEKVALLQSEKVFVTTALVTNESNKDKFTDIELFFRNRGFYFKVFDSINNAKNWLLGNS